MRVVLSPYAIAALLVLGTTACVSGEKTFVLQPINHDRAAVAVGSELTLWAASHARRSYFIIPGGGEPVHAEVVSFELEPAGLLEGRAEGGYLYVRALAAGSATITVRAEVLGRESEASTTIDVREVARVQWHIDKTKIDQTTPTLLVGHYYLATSTPVDSGGGALFADKLDHMEVSEGVSQRAFEDSVMIMSEAPGRASVSYGNSKLELDFALPSASSLVFDTVESGFALGRPSFEVDAPLVIMPRSLSGSAEVLSPKVCTTRIETWGEGTQERDWQEDVRVRPIEQVRSGTCRVRALVQTDTEPVLIEGTFQIEALFRGSGMGTASGRRTEPGAETP